MQSRKLPALIAVFGVVLAVALFLLLKDDTAEKDTEIGGNQAAQPPDPKPDDKGDEPKPEPRPEEPEIPQIEIKDGQPFGGVQQIEVMSGETGALEVTSDVDDELHFHVYDAYIGLKAGEPSEFSFKADIEGVFELESHTTGVLIAEISVVP